MEFLHGQWVNSKLTMNFELTLLISNWSYFLPLLILKLIWNSPKFQTQPLVIKFKPRDTSKRVPNAFTQFEMPYTHLKLIIFEAF